MAAAGRQGALHQGQGPDQEAGRLMAELDDARAAR
mgnify:CR=1 FL=1